MWTGSTPGVSGFQQIRGGFFTPAEFGIIEEEDGEIILSMAGRACAIDDETGSAVNRAVSNVGERAVCLADADEQGGADGHFMIDAQLQAVLAKVYTTNITLVWVGGIRGVGGRMAGEVTGDGHKLWEG